MIGITQLEKYYGSYHALRGIDLEIKAGEFFSLLGPSGCGKTTLLRTIAGLERPDSGRLVIDGQDMRRVPANRRPTNMVFQSYAIFPHMTVAENVAYGLRRRRLPKAERAELVDAALAKVGLSGFGARAAHALSGGQRQRVALARAVILEPKVLLLDEPLSALDRQLREDMQSELRTLQRRLGITFVLVTHDQEEALTMSDRVAVMFDGQIAQLSTPQELYQSPASKTVAAFFGHMNLLPAEVVETGPEAIAVEIAGLGRAAVPQHRARGIDQATPVCAGLRPELLTLIEAGTQTADRVVDGVIAETTYVGELTYYDIALDGLAVPVSVSMRNSSDQRILDPGTKVRLGWTDTSVIVLADPDAG